MKYKDFQTKGQLVYQKMQNHELLTQEDLEIIQMIVLDPLMEFVRREALFRLVYIFGMGNEEVNEDLLEEVEETISDAIDESWYLYDDIDERIAKVLKEGE